MDKTKIIKWIDDIINEDGHNLSSGSLRTLKMILDETQKPQSPTEIGQQGVEEWAHMIDWININYTPRIKKDFVMWNLDGADPLYTTEEAIKDYFEHNPSQPTPPQVGQDELWIALFNDLDNWSRSWKGSGDTIVKIKELQKQFTLIKK